VSCYQVFHLTPLRRQYSTARTAEQQLEEGDLGKQLKR